MFIENFNKGFNPNLTSIDDYFKTRQAGSCIIVPNNEGYSLFYKSDTIEEHKFSSAKEICEKFEEGINISDNPSYDIYLSIIKYTIEKDTAPILEKIHQKGKERFGDLYQDKIDIDKFLTSNLNFLVSFDRRFWKYVLYTKGMDGELETIFYDPYEINNIGNIKNVIFDTPDEVVQLFLMQIANLSRGENRSIIYKDVKYTFTVQKNNGTHYLMSYMKAKMLDRDSHLAYGDMYYQKYKLSEGKLYLANW